MKHARTLTLVGGLALIAAGLVPAAEAQIRQGPQQRWGADAMRRPLTPDRPLDFRRKPAVRVYPKVKPVEPPYLKAAPRYGEPEAPIERIPET